jgi:TonB family protein
MKKLGFLILFVSMADASNPLAARETAQVLTNFSLLVGLPEAEESEVSGTLLVSGTVIPLEGEQPSKGSEPVLRVPVDLLGKLRKALRLEHVLPRNASLKPVAVGQRTLLRSPSEDSSIHIHATLMGYNEDLATYRIEFSQDGQVLSDSKVSVRMGERAVVGALDGEAAPYLFLVVRPESPGGLPPPPVLDQAPPRILEKVFAAYPKPAKEKKIQGVVIVQGLVQTNGQITDLEVQQDPDPILSRAALDSIRQWMFQPVVDEGGVPVPVQFTVTTNFRLQ